MQNHKHKIWIPKEGFRVTFKGRKPRALMWRKRLYEEWFEYAKLAQSIGYKIPTEFKDLSSYSNFEQWWRDPTTGAELFLEPFYDRSVLEADCNNYEMEDNKLLVELDLNRSLNQLKLDFRLLLEKHHVTNSYIPRAKFQPSKPMSLIRLFNAEHEHNEKRHLPVRLDIPRKVYLLSKKGLTQTEIGYQLRFLEGYASITDNNFKKRDVYVSNDEVYEWKKKTTGRGNTANNVFDYWKDRACSIRLKSSFRRVTRNLRQCESIFKNIEKGTFP